MNCAEANQIVMVGYLNSIRNLPQKINGNDYRYLSQLRSEKHTSFKVEKSKNVWDDQGISKCGNMIDFMKEMHQCEVSEAVQKLLSFHRQNIAKNNTERPRFHLHENSLIHHENARETGTRIIAAKQSLKDLILCRYVKQRNISKMSLINVAMKFILLLVKKKNLWGCGF